MAHKISSASDVNDGAMTTSVKVLLISAAVSPFISPLTAMIPPNALIGSAPCAREYASKIVGANEVLSYGGQVKVIPFIDGFSTTNIETKIKQGA